MNCPYCGTQNEPGFQFCKTCGAKLPASAPQPQYQAPQQPYGQAPYGQAPYGQPSYDPPVQESTGGLIAWAVITLLLCTIPGIVALVQTTGINKCATRTEQEKKLSSARTWNIVGTILGALSLIGSIAQMAL